MWCATVLLGVKLGRQLLLRLLLLLGCAQLLTVQWAVGNDLVSQKTRSVPLAAPCVAAVVDCAHSSLLLPLLLLLLLLPRLWYAVGGCRFGSAAGGGSQHGKDR
jgi:hypothetical protein